MVFRICSALRYSTQLFDLDAQTGSGGIYFPNSYSQTADNYGTSIPGGDNFTCCEVGATVRYSTKLYHHAHILCSCLALSHGMVLVSLSNIALPIYIKILSTNLFAYFWNACRFITIMYFSKLFW